MEKHVIILNQTHEFDTRSAKRTSIFSKTYVSISKDVLFYMAMAIVLLSSSGLYYVGYLGISITSIGVILPFGFSIHRYLKPVLEMNLDFRLTEDEQRELMDELW